jgi:hypothetical protein
MRSRYFRSIHLRNGTADSPGLEAVGVVVEHDNLATHPNASMYVTSHKPTAIAPTPPNVRIWRSAALRVDDPANL